jgi:hypothetical protein
VAQLFSLGKYAMKALGPKPVAIIAAIFALASLGVAIISQIELRASNVLLSKSALLRPGMNLCAMTNQLGPVMYERTSADDVLNFGSVKDENFCRGKKLFWFYVSTPPCRVLEVYTDTNNIVIYVTWQGL